MPGRNISNLIYNLSLAINCGGDTSRVLSLFKTFQDKGISLEAGAYVDDTILYTCISGLSTRHHDALENMIDTLLKQGADPNAPGGLQRSTCLLDLIISKPKGWDALFIRLLDHGADPFIMNNNEISAAGLVARLSVEHPVRKKIENSPLYQFKTAFAHLATVTGTTTYTGHAGKSVVHKGGNQTEEIAWLLKDLCSEYIEALKESDPSFLKFQKGCELLPGLFEKEKESIKKALEFCSHTPLMIPSGWSGHAISFVLFQNRLYICNRGDRPKEVSADIGVQIYEAEMNEANLTKLVNFKNSLHEAEALLPFVTKELKGKLLQEIPYTAQKHPNCTWANTAGLGLRVVLDIASSGAIDSLSEEVRPAHKKFLQFAKLKTLERAIHALKNCPQEADNPLQAISPISSLCLKSLRKIKEGKDPFGYHRKMVDWVTFSGIPNFLMDEGDIDEIWPFYASLYGIKDVQAFIKTLMYNI